MKEGPESQGFSDPPPEPPPIPAADVRRGNAGCLKVLCLGCGGFALAVLIAVALLFLNFRAFVVKLERNFIIGVVERTELREAGKEVLQILDEYEADSRKERLTLVQWWEALSAFAQSPAALVLGLQDARSKVNLLGEMEPVEAERAREVLARLAAGVAEGKVTSAEVRQLVEDARKARSARPADATEVADIGREELARFIPGAEKLLEERQVGAGSPHPDLPALLRRDLRASLEQAKN